MDQGLKLSEPQVYELLWSFEARSKSAWVGVQMTPDPGRHRQLPICFPFPTLNCHWKPCFVYNDIIHNFGWGTINGLKPTMTILFPFSQPFHPGQWELNRKSTRHFWKIKISFSDRDINGCHGSSLFFLSWTKGIKNGPAQGHVICLSDSQENFMFIGLYLTDTEPTLTSVYLRIFY